MANHHHISRFLTASWQVEPGRLHSYDFATGSFADGAPESLFAGERTEPEGAESILGALVETPAEKYRAEILGGVASGNSSGDWKVYRALVAMIWLQVMDDPRSRIAMPEENPCTLEGLCAQRETLLDLMGTMSKEQYPLIGVPLPPSAAPLYLTEAGYFHIPMVGSAPILAVPLTPRHFIATPQKGFSGETLTQWLLHPAALSAFSLGAGPIDRVVIPPEFVAQKEANPLAFQHALHEQRSTAEGLLEVVAEASRMVITRGLGGRR
jgi:hypothetical protein